MIESTIAVRRTSRAIQEAVERTCNELIDRAVEEEPAFTDRMLEGIQRAVESVKIPGIRWRGKTFTSHGPGSQERPWGADFAGVFDAQLPDFRLEKGFLAQAKLVDKDWKIPTNRIRETVGQCKQMLAHSPDSFLFLYSEEGVWVVPATSVVSTNPKRLVETYGRRVAGFFELQFTSFVGDPNLSWAAVTSSLVDDESPVVPRAIALQVLGEP